MYAASNKYKSKKIKTTACTCHVCHKKQKNKRNNAKTKNNTEIMLRNTLKAKAIYFP